MFYIRKEKISFPYVNSWIARITKQTFRCIIILGSHICFKHNATIVIWDTSIGKVSYLLYNTISFTFHIVFFCVHKNNHFLNIPLNVDIINVKRKVKNKMFILNSEVSTWYFWILGNNVKGFICFIFLYSLD